MRPSLDVGDARHIKLFGRAPLGSAGCGDMSTRGALLLLSSRPSAGALGAADAGKRCCRGDLLRLDAYLPAGSGLVLASPSEPGRGECSFESDWASSHSRGDITSGLPPCSYASGEEPAGMA